MLYFTHTHVLKKARFQRKIKTFNWSKYVNGYINLTRAKKKPVLFKIINNDLHVLKKKLVSGEVLKIR